MLELRNVKVRMPTHDLTIDSQLQVGRGETLGVFGPNGSGKSTLLGVASGHVHSYQSRQRLHGHDISRWSRRRRVRMGILRNFQEPRPFASLTLAQAVKVYRSDSGLFADLIEHLSPGIGLAAQLGSLSVGQTRLAELSLLLAKSSDVLLLDEPCAGLDSSARTRLAVYLRDRLDDRCLVIVEHDQRFLRIACGDVLPLRTRFDPR